MNRVTVSMVEGKERLKLSLLKEQKELLRRIGEGNVSAGFRKVLGVVTDCVHFAKVTQDDGLDHTARYADAFYQFIEAFNADSND